MKKTIGALVMTMLLLFFAAACTGGKVTEEDFSLTVTVNAENLNQNQDLIAEAVFSNLNGGRRRIVHPGGEDISSMIQAYIFPAGTEHNYVFLANKVENTLKKNAVIKSILKFPDLQTGEYELVAAVSFEIGEQKLLIKSNVINITVN